MGHENTYPSLSESAALAATLAGGDSGCQRLSDQTRQIHRGLATNSFRIERVTVENADRVSTNIGAFGLILSINIPDDLYREAQEIAEADQVSLEQVFTSALLGHVSAWRRLRERAAQGDRKKFSAVLNRVSDVEPEEFDAL